MNSGPNWSSLQTRVCMTDLSYGERNRNHFRLTPRVPEHAPNVYRVPQKEFSVVWSFVIAMPFKRGKEKCLFPESRKTSVNAASHFIAHYAVSGCPNSRRQSRGELGEWRPLMRFHYPLPCHAPRSRSTAASIALSS